MAGEPALGILLDDHLDHSLGYLIELGLARQRLTLDQLRPEAVGLDHRGKLNHQDLAILRL